MIIGNAQGTPVSQSKFVVAGLVVGIFGLQANAQNLRVNTPASGNFGGITNVGSIANTPARFQHANTTSLLQTPGQGGSVRQPNLLTPGISIPSGSNVGVDLIGRTGKGGFNSDPLTATYESQLAPTGAARYFRLETNFNTAAMNPGMPGTSSPGAQLLLSPQALLRDNAFLSPAAGRPGINNTSIDDAVAADPMNPPARYDLQPVSFESSNTMSDLMTDQLQSLRKRKLKEAWEWFKMGEFSRARSTFSSAEMLNREDPEPRVGALFCSIAEKNYAIAGYNTARIFAWDAGRDLVIPYPVIQYYRSEEAVSEDMKAMLKFAQENSKDVRNLAALAYSLWYLGKPQEAIRAAKTIKQIDAGNPLARLEEMFNAAGTEIQARIKANRPG